MIRVEAIPALTEFGVAIRIAQQYGEDCAPVQILHLKRADDGTVSADWSGWTEHRPGEMVAPTLVLSDEIARPLLDALSRYYNGAEDSRALRRDYDGERKRVDTLIGHLAVVARALSEPQP
jgi:hypothetical protein